MTDEVQNNENESLIDAAKETFGPHLPLNQRLYRSRHNSLIGGVCGGIEERYGIDATLVRILWLSAALGTSGAFLLGYLLAILLIPLNDSQVETPVEMEIHQSNRRWFMGILITFALLLILFGVLEFTGATNLWRG